MKVISSRRIVASGRPQTAAGRRDRQPEPSPGRRSHFQLQSLFATLRRGAGALGKGRSPGWWGGYCLAAGLVSCGGGGADSTPYRHVILISMDTTRADHLAAYGHPEVKTPGIDALAAEGVLFEQCTSAAATTLASHTSLLTGTYPNLHGVGRNGFLVNGENRLLAEVLAEAGFYCAAFLGSSALTAKSGLDAGFDVYDDAFDLTVEEGGRDQDQRVAADVTAALLAHVDALDDRRAEDSTVPDRLFMMAHYFDPHAPYAPGEALAQRYGASFQVGDFSHIEGAVRTQQARLLDDVDSPATAPGQQGVITAGLPKELITGVPGVPSGTGRTLAKLYAGEVTRTDAAIGALLAGLATRGILDDALVILTADHGETFWEHGNFWNHGLWVNETDVHVPLILRFPDGRGAGKRVPTPVSNVDVMPTVLEALGLPAAAQDSPGHGRSVLASVDGQALALRAVFAEATQPGAGLEQAVQGIQPAWLNARKPQAVRLGPWKLVDAPYLATRQLFHLGRDPGEQRDLLADGPLAPDAEEALGDLAAALERWRKGASPKPSSFDRSQIAVLKGMGYGETEQDE